jgi:flagellar operon protein
MINKISSAQNCTPQTIQKPQTAKTGQSTFNEMLRARQAGDTQTVEFSKHAIARAEERGIEVDDTLLHQLSDSVEKAQGKGVNNILAFDSTRAFVINVPNCRVITAISKEEIKENIFTNIDGAVIL